MYQAQSLDTQIFEAKMFLFSLMIVFQILNHLLQLSENLHEIWLHTRMEDCNKRIELHNE